VKRHISVVVVPSTFCNLRCSYCYELPLLKDKSRIGEDSLVRMFEHLGAYFEEQDVASARIIWHGGEPLLLPPEYFWKAFEIQKRAFAGLETKVAHVTQTNLTVLDEERITLIRDGFTDTGVSLDLFGSLRLNAGGVCKEDLAKKNLELLLGRGIGLTGITVLTKGNRRRVQQIYEFYRDRSMNFRLLPLHRGDYGSGHWFEISAADTLRAFCLLADLWLDNPEGPLVHPIYGVVREVYAALINGQPSPIYDKRSFEPLLVIDRDGGVYPYSDFPSDTSCYGNVFRDPLSTILSSESHERVMVATEARMKATCTHCEQFGKACTGTPVAEYTQDFWDRDADGRLRCTFKGLIDHVKARFIEAGMLSAPSVVPAALTSPTAAAIS
jgi:uncharacterized protein